VNRLAKLIDCTGEWHGSKVLNDPSRSEPEISKADAELTPLLEGRFVRLDYTWRYRGERQEGSLLIGCDPDTAVASVHWIDMYHMGRSVMVSSGTCGDDGVISVLGSYAAPPGPDWGWRTVITPGGQERLEFAMYNITPDGREELAVEARFERP
jgi:hypothetical protein